jgi:RNA polymerase sigma-70 factor (ECF subfamily)
MDVIKPLSSTAEDNYIIDRILAGEKNLYELLMRKYNQRLYRISRSYISDEDDVLDCMQEAYIKAYEQLPKFEKRSQFSTWLIRILINESLARIKYKSRIVYPMNNGSNYFDDNFDTHDRHNLNPESLAANSELKKILETAVDSLPDKYRTVFIMREIEGMSVAETGKCLGLTESNVKVRLNRAKEVLRKNISKFYKNEEVFSFKLNKCDRVVNYVLNHINHN